MIDDVVDRIFELQLSAHLRIKPVPWSEEQDSMLAQLAGKLSDADIARLFGRSTNAIKVYRLRAGFESVSRAHTEWVTINHAAEDMLGIDSHKLSHWCDEGLIPTVRHGGMQMIRLIKTAHLTAWVVNPDNWVYFRWREIIDPHLRRLCELRQMRWGDEWLNTTQVAEMHGVANKDIVRQILLGKLPAVQPPVSLGGRHPQRRWKVWFIKRSDAEQIRVPRHGMDLSKFTPRADAWVLRAREELGLSWSAIARTMGVCHETVRSRYDRLRGIQ